MTDVTTPSVVDGRRARSERSKAAVADAMLGFARDGIYEPTSSEIAERAGITQRTLFRHFGTIDDIFVALVERQTDFVTPFLLPMDRTGTIDDRVRRLVDNRIALYEAIAPIRRAGLRVATQHEVIAEALELMTTRIQAQIDELFANDLRRAPIAGRASSSSMPSTQRRRGRRGTDCTVCAVSTRKRAASTMAQLVRCAIPAGLTVRGLLLLGLLLLARIVPGNRVGNEASPADDRRRLGTTRRCA